MNNKQRLGVRGQHHLQCQIAGGKKVTSSHYTDPSLQPYSNVWKIELIRNPKGQTLGSFLTATFSNQRKIYHPWFHWAGIGRCHPSLPLRQNITRTKERIRFAPKSSQVLGVRLETSLWKRPVKLPEVPCLLMAYSSLPSATFLLLFCKVYLRPRGITRTSRGMRESGPASKNKGRSSD